MLEIRLLGECAIFRDDQPVTRVDSPRLQSLLAYLLLHRSAPVPRHYVAFRLWPESAEDQARTNLRQLLHHLKHALPDGERYLSAGAKTLQWNPSEPLRLDVAEFERLLDERRLDEAVSLYRGRVLPSCYDDWIQPERDRLEQRFREALAHLARAARDRGDHEGAVRWGRQRVRDAPVDEAAYLDLIRAQLTLGNRAEAMQTFHACASVLSRELGVGPSPATLAAYRTLLQSEGKEAPTLAAESQLFVGRVPELAQLKAAVAEARSGRPSVAVVLGEAGIGKSRLADELRRWATRQGLATAWTRAYPTSETLAYAPATDWLRSDAIRPTLQRLDKPSQRELSRLLPELATDRRNQPASLTHGWQRLRLFEAMARAVLSSGRVQLLVLDDLQWCDAETLDWLAFLMRFDPGAKVFLLATARVEELPAGHRVASFLRELPILTRVELGPLVASETAALASSVRGHELDPGEAERVFRETEGNPLFVVESARAGTGSQRAQAVIAGRLDALTPEAQELLALAAAIGRAFSYDLLASALGWADEDLVRCLDDVWSRRLIRDHGERGYDFAHDRIREEAYARLSTARKRLYHHAIAQALERASAVDPDGAAAQVAFHYDRAGRQAEAAAWYARAAAASRRIFANVESLALYERALELGADGGEREVSLLVSLGGPLVALKGYGAPRALEVYRRALDLSSAAGVPSAPALRALAIAYLVCGQLREAEAIGGQLLGAAEDDPVVRVEAEYVLGVTCFWMGRFAEAIAHLDESVARTCPDLRPIHREQFTQDPEVVCLVRSALALWHIGSPDRALDRSQAALRLARDREHPFSLAYVLHWKAWLHVLREDVSARDATEESVSFSLEHDFAYWHTQGRVLRGWARGDRREMEEGLAAFRDTGAEVGRPYFVTLLGRALEREGRVDEARRALDEALASVRERDERWCEAEVLSALGELEGAAGDGALARTWLLEALDVAKAQGAVTIQRRVAASLLALEPSKKVTPKRPKNGR